MTQQDVERVARHNEQRQREYEASDLIRLLTDASTSDETKKAVLREGAKALHLSYLGDAEIGAGANIGAGVITCNYDGVRKHRTSIGEGAFVGSDSQLVAPVTVGKGAYVGAGSTITRDVPDGDLAVTRTPQKNLAGWAAKRRRKERGQT